MACLILGFLLTLSGCFKSEPIKIGVVGTMTGPNSDLSVSGRRGVEMAVDEINLSGGLLGRPIELVIKDDKNNHDMAKLVDQELVAEGVNLIIGHYTSGMIMGSLEYINEKKVLMLSPTISADALSGKDDYFIRFISSTVDQATLLVDYIKERNDKNFVILSDERNAGFTDQFVRNFSALFLEHFDHSPVIISYNPAVQGSEDLAVQKALLVDPQGVLILAGAEDSARIAQQLVVKNDALNLYGPLWANTPELVKKGGDFVENMIVVGAIDMDNQEESFVQFKTNYFERYGDQPSFSALYSYEAMKVLAVSIENANSFDTTAIKTEMLKTGDYQGVIDRISLNASGDISREYMLFKIQDGQLRMVYPNE